MADSIPTKRKLCPSTINETTQRTYNPNDQTSSPTIIQDLIVQCNKLAMEQLRIDQFKDCFMLLKKAENLLKESLPEQIAINDRNRLFSLTMNNLGCYYKKHKKAIAYARSAIQDLESVLDNFRKGNLQKEEINENSLLQSMSIAYYNLAVEYEHCKDLQNALNAYQDSHEYALMTPQGESLIESTKNFIDELTKRINQVEENKTLKLINRAQNGTMSIYKDLEHLKMIQRAKVEREQQNLQQYIEKISQRDQQSNQQQLKIPQSHLFFAQRASVKTSNSQFQKSEFLLEKDDMRQNVRSPDIFQDSGSVLQKYFAQKKSKTPSDTQRLKISHFNQMRKSMNSTQVSPQNQDFDKKRKIMLSQNDARKYLDFKQTEMTNSNKSSQKQAVKRFGSTTRSTAMQSFFVDDQNLSQLNESQKEQQPNSAKKATMSMLKQHYKSYKMKFKDLLFCRGGGSQRVSPKNQPISIENQKEDIVSQEPEQKVDIEKINRKALYKRLIKGQHPIADQYNGKDLNKFILAISTRKNRQ